MSPVDTGVEPSTTALRSAGGRASRRGEVKRSVRMRFAGTPLQIQTAPPLLGQHSNDILSELGYNARDIEALRCAGAI